MGEPPSPQRRKAGSRGSWSAWCKGREDTPEDVGRTEQQKLPALKQLYRQTVKDRPRNLVGSAKDLPAQNMQALIVQNMVIPDLAWEALANARAQAVRVYLLL